jgi:hypothetical protein
LPALGGSRLGESTISPRGEISPEGDLGPCHHPVLPPPLENSPVVPAPVPDSQRSVAHSRG